MIRCRKSASTVSSNPNGKLSQKAIVHTAHVSNLHFQDASWAQGRERVSKGCEINGLQPTL